MQPGGNAFGLPEPLAETPAVQRSVEAGVWSGVLVAAGAEPGGLMPPGATRPQEARIQAHASGIRIGLNRDPPAEGALCFSSRGREKRAQRLAVSGTPRPGGRRNPARPGERP